jgi:hypothetical protein
MIHYFFSNGYLNVILFSNIKLYYVIKNDDEIRLSKSSIIVHIDNKSSQTSVFDNTLKRIYRDNILNSR